MTTAKTIQTPEPDTKPDAIPIEKKPPVEEAKTPMNALNLWLAAAVSVFILGSGVVAVIINNDRTDQRSLQTEAKVDKMETVVNRIPVIETQMVNLGKTTDRIEGDIRDVKRLLEARK